MIKKSFTLSEIKDGILKKEFSCLEITTHYLERAERYKNLNAYVLLNHEKATASAKAVDAIKTKDPNKTLLGVPLGIKDLYCTKGIRTTACSKMLENFVPEYESTVTQNLLDSGAIFLGKTNMDEFAMGSANITSVFGNCYLPYKKQSSPETKLSPGGSSGGSAVAVAADLCAASIGSDTGGSIRQPAAVSGLVGLKPTYGLCSRYGMVAFASSFDQAGPITKTVEDSAIMLGAMAGHDAKDSTSLNVQIPDYSTFLGKSIKGLKIGLAPEYLDLLEPWGLEVIEKTKNWLIDAGCEIVYISLKTTPYSLPAYHIIAPAEASSNLARYDGVRYGYRSENFANIDELYINSRSEGFGEEVKRRILIGTYILSAGHYEAYYKKALKIQQMVKEDFQENGFAKVDMVLTLTTPKTAIGVEETKSMSPIEMYLSDIFTVTANIAGLPAISIPADISHDGLPIGVQLIGNSLQEGLLFQVASVIEKSANFEDLREKILCLS